MTELDESPQEHNYLALRGCLFLVLIPLLTFYLTVMVHWFPANEHILWLFPAVFVAVILAIVFDFAAGVLTAVIDALIDEN